MYPGRRWCDYKPFISQDGYCHAHRPARYSLFLLEIALTGQRGALLQLARLDHVPKDVRKLARKGRTPMPSTALQADIMIALVLASDPGQVGITRCLVRAALEYRGLGHYAPEAEIIASELVTNAIQHARSTDPADKIGVTLMRVCDRKAISVVVTDSSPLPPVRHETTTASEQGRGLQIVEALSAHWGWNHEQGGKAVYAILAK